MYKEFAQIYDRLMADTDYDLYENRLRARLEEAGALGGRLLELGCGTGNLTRRLAPSFSSLFGLDKSEAMLNRAWPKLASYPRVTLTCQDVRSFQAPQSDACCCLLDTLNYLDDEEDLLACFRRVADCLQPGAPFLFDLNSRKRLFQDLGNHCYVYDFEDEQGKIYYGWDNTREGETVASFLTFFVQEDGGCYQRIDEEQVQHFFDLPQVTVLLRKAGFEKIDYRDLDTDGKVGENTRRILCSCRNKIDFH